MNKSRQIIRSTQFKKDLKKVSASGRYDVQDFLDVVDMLSKDISLPKNNCDPYL